jgi:Flp pilus assembly protein TadD
MQDVELNQLIRKGVVAAEKGDTLVALVHFEDAAKLEATPTVRSYLAFCLARERRQLQKAISLCNEALQQEPNNPLHFLNLGRVYLVAGQKGKAIQTLRRGLKLGRNPLIMEELKRLGMRQPPVFPSMGREHPLNKYLGLMLKRLGMR